jgi:hypothetical protein
MCKADDHTRLRSYSRREENIKVPAYRRLQCRTYFVVPGIRGVAREYYITIYVLQSI